VRVLHLMTMLDASPKMRHILHGLGKAIPGVINVVGILMMFFYIYAVMGVFLFQDAGVAGFDHIGASMRTMFQVLTGDDWAKIMDSAEQGMRYAWIFFISFYIIVVFVILNLFIGVVVGAMQTAEEEVYRTEEDDNETSMKVQVNRLEEKLEAIHAILRRKPSKIK
jgi:voltage-gated sodium channel